MSSLSFQSFKLYNYLFTKNILKENVIWGEPIKGALNLKVEPKIK